MLHTSQLSREGFVVGISEYSDFIWSVAEIFEPVLHIADIVVDFVDVLEAFEARHSAPCRVVLVADQEDDALVGDVAGQARAGYGGRGSHSLAAGGGRALAQLSDLHADLLDHA